MVQFVQSFINKVATDIESALFYDAGPSAQAAEDAFEAPETKAEVCAGMLCVRRRQVPHITTIPLESLGSIVVLAR